MSRRKKEWKEEKAGMSFNTRTKKSLSSAHCWGIFLSASMEGFDSSLNEWAEMEAPHCLNCDLEVKHPSNSHVKVYPCTHAGKAHRLSQTTTHTRVHLLPLEWAHADRQTDKSGRKHSSILTHKNLIKPVKLVHMTFFKTWRDAVTAWTSPNGLPDGHKDKLRTSTML